MKRLLLYAHYDAENKIKPYVVHTLISMKSVCEDIVFITNSPMENVEYEKIKDLCSKVISRENIGYDFSMWKTAINQYDYSQYDEVVLSNSSVVGPIFSIDKLFSHMEKHDCDFWGVTENFQISRHLQSYFLVFKKNVTSSKSFREFWDGILEYENKWQVVLSYEVGLTQWFVQKGFSFKSYCPWSEILSYASFLKIDRFKKPKNPTITFWRELFQFEVPFIKNEVIRNLTKNDAIFLLEQDSVKLLVEKEIIDIVVDDFDKNNNCPVCHDSGDLYFRRLRDRLIPYSQKIWNFYKCTNSECRCLWIDPLPNKKQTKASYDGYYTHQGLEVKIPFKDSHSDNFVCKQLLSLGKRILKLLKIDKKRKNYYLHGLLGVKPAKVLEIGCGSGTRLNAFKKLGWDVEGQEVDPLAAKYCKDNYGVEVHCGELVALGLPESTYDVVLMSHVLEHLANPQQILEAAFRLIKPGGELRISTPNAEGLSLKIHGKNSFLLDPPRHLSLHTRGSLSKLFENIGFSQFEIKSIALNAELVSMHSIDVKKYGWTSNNDVHRLKKEISPVWYQIFCFFVNAINKNSGDELFVIAKK